MWFGAIYDTCHQSIVIKGFYRTQEIALRDLVNRLPDAVWEKPLDINEENEEIEAEELLECMCEHYSTIDHSYCIILESSELVL